MVFSEKSMRRMACLQLQRPKFKCELGYCHKAIIKTGVGVFKGVHDLVRQADDDIEAFRMMESGQVALN